MGDLTAVQQRELLNDLDLLQVELKQLLKSTAAASDPVSLDQPIGRLSRMDAMQQQEMSKANRASLECRLQLVEAARQRARQDRYGVCCSCEEPIAYQRLRAYPETAFCLECQRERER